MVSIYIYILIHDSFVATYYASFFYVLKLTKLYILIVDVVFNYCPRIHNVVMVDEAGYNTCSAEKPLMELKQSVRLALTLSAGGTFGFISSMGQDCQNGMKLLIRVREKNKLT